MPSPPRMAVYRLTPRLRCARAAAILAVASVALSGGAGCSTLRKALGFREEPAPGAALEIRNDADIAVNLYLLGRSGVHLQPAFLGWVHPRSVRRFRIEGTTPGDTVWLRARPIDGRPELARGDAVVGPGRVWRIP